MAKVSVYNMDGQQVEEMELNDAVFGAKVNEHLMHMSVIWHLANKRQGTQSAKTRSEVRGGGAKPWRQKGTGRARAGTIRAPHFTGGGVVFAPKPRDHSFKLNKKERRAALRSALSTKVSDGKLLIIDELKLDEVKTKKMNLVLNNLNTTKALIVLADNDQNIVLSARNIQNVKTASVNTINVYDILKYDTFIVTKAAAANIEEVYA